MTDYLLLFVGTVLVNNFVLVKFLGLCPFMGVSKKLETAMGMGLATTFVLVASNGLISSLRNFIPKQVRIATYILIIATFVTLIDYGIQATSVALHKSLGAFISLIVVNCLILGRAEAFASKNPVGLSLLDGLGMGLGFTFALSCLGALREIMGNGSLLNVQIFGEAYQEWIVMILPAGGFFTLAIWLLFFNVLKKKKMA